MALGASVNAEAVPSGGALNARWWANSSTRLCGVSGLTICYSFLTFSAWTAAARPHENYSTSSSVPAPADGRAPLKHSMLRMEPSRVTAPDLAGVLDELVAREPIFHRPELGT